MHEITDLSYNAINRYFTTLAQFGYKNYSAVDKLIALLTLEEMLNIFPEYIDEKSFRSIINAIYCLSGTTCLIDFPHYINSDTLFHKTRINFAARITEDSVLRIAENDIIRTEA